MHYYVLLVVNTRAPSSRRYCRILFPLSKLLCEIVSLASYSLAFVYA